MTAKKLDVNDISYCIVCVYYKIKLLAKYKNYQVDQEEQKI